MNNQKGLKYHLNELRQKVKFNKDLILYYLWYKIVQTNRAKYIKEKQIPKVIHYVWCGNEMPKEIQTYIKGWKEKMPDYKFKLWNETNFPFDKYPFAQEALKLKKWAFISDVVRLHALYYEGGVYMDTDVEVLKSFDDLLQHEVFSCCESPNLIAVGTVGAQKHHPWIGMLLCWYKMIHCDEDYTEIANTRIVSKLTRMFYGIKLDGKTLQTKDGVRIFTRDYFAPQKIEDKWCVTDNTYCIHHYSGLW